MKIKVNETGYAILFAISITSFMICISLILGDVKNIERIDALEEKFSNIEERISAIEETFPLENITLSWSCQKSAISTWMNCTIPQEVKK